MPDKRDSQASEKRSCPCGKKGTSQERDSEAQEEVEQKNLFYQSSQTFFVESVSDYAVTNIGLSIKNSRASQTDLHEKCSKEIY
jgi:hypothetical protein